MDATIIESNHWGTEITGPRTRKMEIEAGGNTEIYGEITEGNIFFEFKNSADERGTSWLSLDFEYDPFTGKKIGAKNESI